MTTQTTHTSSFQRRDFLKLMAAGLASTWALSASSAPLTNWFLSPALTAQTTFGSLLLRGTNNGQIMQSQDQGKSWQLLIAFSEHFDVRSLLTKDGQVFAQMAVSGHTFWLSSQDAKTWRTLS